MTIDFEDVLQTVNQQLYAQQKRYLDQSEVGLLQGMWERKTYQDIALRLGYGRGTLRGNYGPRLLQLVRAILNIPDLKKANFRDRIIAYIQQQRQRDTQAAVTAIQHHHFGSLNLDLPRFGHEVEIAQVLQAIQHQRLVMLTGPHGIAKTTCLSNVIQACQSDFDVMVYCQGRDVPTVTLWRSQLSQVSPQIAVSAPTVTTESTEKQATEASSTEILALLQTYRCLLVLDHADDVLVTQATGLPYGPNADYRHLLQRIVTTSHQSCVLWVSTGLLDADIAPSWQGQAADIALSHLTPTEAQQLIHLSPQLALTGTPPAWQALTTYCGGDADLLLATAHYLQTQHQGQIVPPQDWQETPEIDALLKATVEPLGEIELALLYILSLQPQTLAEIKQHWQSALPLPTQQIDHAVSQLRYQCLIQQAHVNHPMQLRLPIMQRYLLTQLITSLITELQTEVLSEFHRYPLLIPTASPPIQQNQRQAVLAPIADAVHRLCQGQPQQIRNKLIRLLKQIRQSPAILYSQAAGNLLNIASHLGLSMAGTNFSQLTITHADLSTVDLTGSTLTDCNFCQTRWASGLHAPLVAALSPQGNYLAVGDPQGQVNIYRLGHHRRSTRLERRLSQPAGIEHLSWDQTDQLSMIGQDQQLSYWSIPTDTIIGDRIGSSHSQCLAQATKAPYLAIGHRDGQVTLIDADGLGPDSLTANDHAIQAIALAPDGLQLALYAWDAATIDCWSLPDGLSPVLQRQISCQRLGTVMTLQWGPLGLQIVEEVEQSVYLKIESGEMFVLPQSPIMATLATFSDNGHYLAVGTTQQIHVYAIASPAPNLIRVISRNDERGLSDLAIDNSGQWICCTTPSQVTLWRQDSIQYLVQETPEPQLYRECQITNAQGLSTADVAIARYLGATV